ncbi:Wzz/FepE/Etk N-terminal domain-containing protein [Phocaeicola coprophilus]|uniref:Wzz/FepE/Etk N-terminal domain-containing protein n=1 Tax=Phocaeicola coprophilus TaxID=387090 RepID=UPI00265853C8|nr:Wzz/FepE/Etk N-terminal domain-containing protein [Phocaeicola coprophilus]
MGNNQQVNMEIDLRLLIYNLWNKRKTILKIMGIGLLAGIVIAFSIPKTYKVDITLSPESGQNGNRNSFAGMPSMLGIGGIGGNGQDALNSTMFPDLIKSTPFILEIYNVEVTPQKSQHAIKLSDYIDTQKSPWWGYIFKLPGMAINGIRSLFISNENTNDSNNIIDPFRLTGEQNGKIALIKGALSATVDSKSNMTIVSATFQDPEVAATVADSAVAKLQKYIIDYRTRKAQEDCNYLEKLCKERKEEYYKAQKAYADFMDANRNVVLQRTQAEGTRLQNDMSIAFQIYSQVETQLQVARAKVQEAKPVFAIVEPATVPLSPSSPNKKIIILGLMFLGFIGSSAWILFGKELWHSLRSTNKESND